MVDGSIMLMLETRTLTHTTNEHGGACICDNTLIRHPVVPLRSTIDDDESTTTMHNVFETYCFGCTMVLNMFVGGSFAFGWGSFYVESLRERVFFVEAKYSRTIKSGDSHFVRCTSEIFCNSPQ